MQNTQGGMNSWFYQSDMTVETVGLFKTAERNPEKRPECETHSPRPFTKKSLSVATSAMGKKQRKALLKGFPSVGHTFVL